jgi:hydroxyacylglutathione hydrolase
MSSLYRSFALSRGAKLIFWRTDGIANLAWGLVSASGRVVAVDLPDPQGWMPLLQARNWNLDAIWFTHDHADHIRQSAEFIAEMQCKAYAPAGTRIPGVVSKVADGDVVEAAGFAAKVLETPGHSDHDISYWLQTEGICFCGDILFDGGVGRMFAGPAERFWRSQCRLRSLPESTWLCVGHDYAKDNYAFAHAICPDDAVFGSRNALAANTEEVRFPFTVQDQREGNIFWRADDPEFARTLNLAGFSAAEVFHFLRDAKDRF